MIIGTYDNKLCLLDFRYRGMRKAVDERLRRGLDAVFVEGEDEIIRITIKQMEEYLGGERKVFDIPLLLVGSEFQKTVWKALMEVPYGKTASYIELARTIGNEKAVRAVAAANGANAIAVIIPCHRIIGSDGKLVGYGGGLDVKRRLLKLEQENSSLILPLF